jgi:hypothetical protein
LRPVFSGEQHAYSDVEDIPHMRWYGADGRPHEEDYTIPSGSLVGSGSMNSLVRYVNFASGSGMAQFSVSVASWGYDFGPQNDDPWSMTGPCWTTLTVEFLEHPAGDDPTDDPTVSMMRCGHANDHSDNEEYAIDPAQQQQDINSANEWLLNVAGWGVGTFLGALGPAAGIISSIVWDGLKTFWIAPALSGSTAIYNSEGSPSQACFIRWSAYSIMNIPLQYDTRPYFINSLTTAHDFQLNFNAPGTYKLKLTAELHYGSCRYSYCWDPPAHVYTYDPLQTITLTDILSFTV